jgi:hypothetical protein
MMFLSPCSAVKRRRKRSENVAVSVVWLFWLASVAHALSSPHENIPKINTHSRTADSVNDPGRRKAVVNSVGMILLNCALVTGNPSIAKAYTPDPDPLKESLYLISRIQEATCLQERYISKKLPPIRKMKLTLRLVDKSYRILDQINYISKFIDPNDIVMAAQVGNEAADSLQDAIDFVYGYQKDGDAMTVEQKDFLISALTDTREKLFEFIDYLPDQTKVLEARKRVEEENQLNVDEFDPDLANDAGIYNPIELPWKNRKQ